MKKQSEGENLLSRRAAVDLFQAVLHRKQALDEAMEINGAFNKLSVRDRSFAHMMAATVLRRLGQLDAAIDACLDSGKELKRPVRDILRIGAAQILFMRTPSHAAVDTAVEMAGTSNATAPYKGLVNAVLRRVIRDGEALLASQDAARLNAPDWLWLSWRKAYGVAVARNIAAAALTEAAVDITLREKGAAAANAWAQRLQAVVLPSCSLRLGDDHAPVAELSGFAEGEWWVQDAAAALPARLLGDVKGKRVADLCAAPGGKAMQLAAAGAKVTALDRSQPRLKVMRENLARTRLEDAVETLCLDALAYAPSEKFPLVLIDAPCSATGTLRRHPDAARIKTAEDVERMADLQRRLLDHSFDKVLASGGTLVYAVCSLQAEEAEAQVESLLSRRPSVRRVDAREILSDIPPEFVNARGDVRCLPCHWADKGGIDGFYAAVLRSGL